MREVHLFAGPSAHGLAIEDLAPDVRLLPPARRADVDRLVDRAPPNVLIVCDGVFHSEPAVSHAELCRAIDAGWEVWGVASMGAIRAYELRDEGMKGFGWVYDRFSSIPDFTDDEMCLLHFPEAPYFPMTEALVNVRHALDSLGSSLGIDAEVAQHAIDALGGLWFGDRTIEAVRSALTIAGVDPASVDRLLGWLPSHRIKNLDLRALLESSPWSRRSAA